MNCLAICEALKIKKSQIPNTVYGESLFISWHFISISTPHTHTVHTPFRNRKHVVNIPGWLKFSPFLSQSTLTVLQRNMMRPVNHHSKAIDNRKGYPSVRPSAIQIIHQSR
jgi:hypothetical protein